MSRTAATRRWATQRGTILEEGAASPVVFEGVPIPGLTEAHAYVELDAAGQVRARYSPEKKLHDPNADRSTLTLYQVIGSELVRFESYCHEDSTWGVPNAAMPRQYLVLQGLSPLEPP
ncbi:MAG TPA: hypothetical protein PK668_06845 [Myxococcota bacterium]|nr:hypothetical protein [Myxococcota bacterium]HRY92439.1 hypothetical protein [Myxococcota bacterium]HSA22987.1 hypothetical protein [Myxococcota bacterium]